MAAGLWLCHYYLCTGSKHMTGATDTHFILNGLYFCFINEKAPIENNSSSSCSFSRYWVFVLQPCFIHAAGVNCVVRQFFSISWAVYTRGIWIICSRPERLRLCCSDNDVNTGSWGLGWLVTSGWFNRWMSVGAWNYSPAVSRSCNSTDTVAWSQVRSAPVCSQPWVMYEDFMSHSCCLSSFGLPLTVRQQKSYLHIKGLNRNNLEARASFFPYLACLFSCLNPSFHFPLLFILPLS